ncbi:PREDICTED: disease resistance RPP13-like protein 4 isoform X2 [Populus euphratica]|uniref:Disease resistance RPP13-like protein 4 isoform X2 n=1 Tax=Populus euphratica TaxID=75702 RepID=A0AAJ6V966_POPEU|nr:PREDICTED: disease resistance RPP13-like protein 4 isoform X2 [Populus euphratica]
MSSVVSSRDALTIQQIIASIPDLIDLVSAAKSSIPLLPQLNTDNSITTTTLDAPAPPPATTSSNVNDNNIGSNTTTSISTPGNRNNTTAATATATALSISTSGPAPSLASALDSGSGSRSGSTSTSTTTEGGCNSDGNTTTSNNANIKDKNITADVGNDGSVNSEGESNQKLHNQLEKLTRDLYYVQSACDKLKHLELHVGNQFKSLQRQGEFLQGVLRNLERVRNGTTGNHAILTKQMQLNIKLIAGMVMELKYHIPSPYKLNLANEVLKSQNVSGGDSLNLIDEILKIRVFPENSVVKKRLLMYWWVGEGFIDPKVDADKPEEVADGILKKFLEKGFVEPEIKKRRLVGFRTHSLIRYAVIFVAERVGFFHFDSMGNPTGNFSTSQRACLIKTGEKYSRQALLDLESKPETLHALFNVNDPYPDLNTEWFSRMRNINVLCLGRWENSSKKNDEAETNEAEETKHDVEAESTEFLKGLRNMKQQHHVEVESTEFLKGLRNMKHLKFLSLQGISRINELPETIQKLVNLKILDLNSCHNLEAIPENIVSLQKLTHLDISECYMLDYMPKGFGSLTELQVLKGFVISNLKIKNAGTLDDLKGLPKLRKLSIYTTKKDFPRVQDLKALRHITALQKLTIEWGGKSRVKKKEIRNDSRRLRRIDAFRQENITAVIPDLPEHLVKLDLQCYPETKAPEWLSPLRLKNLQKLYIRGGHLSALGQAQGGNQKWNVKILRLKFLKELKMDWRALHDAFPHLIYLEKFKCPKLTFFPCDGTGVWLDREKLANQPLEELGLTWSFLSKSST